ncbi:MAG: hypothetical protein AAF411_28260 [Myxococcota bacterium]
MRHRHDDALFIGGQVLLPALAARSGDGFGDANVVAGAVLALMQRELLLGHLEHGGLVGELEKVADALHHRFRRADEFLVAALKDALPEARFHLQTAPRVVTPAARAHEHVQLMGLRALKGRNDGARFADGVDEAGVRKPLAERLPVAHEARRLLTPHARVVLLRKHLVRAAHDVRHRRKSVEHIGGPACTPGFQVGVA